MTAPTVRVIATRNGITKEYDVEVSQVDVTRKLGGHLSPGVTGPSISSADIVMKTTPGAVRSSREGSPVQTPSELWPLTADDRVVITQPSGEVFTGRPTSVGYGGAVSLASVEWWHHRKTFMILTLGQTLRKVGAVYRWFPGASADWAAITILRSVGYYNVPPVTTGCILSAPLQQSAVGDTVVYTAGGQAYGNADSIPTFATTSWGFTATSLQAWYSAEGSTIRGLMWVGCRMTPGTFAASLRVQHNYTAGDAWRISVWKLDGTLDRRVTVEHVNSSGAVDSTSSLTIPASNLDTLVAASISPGGTFQVVTGDAKGVSRVVATGTYPAASGASAIDGMPTLSTVSISGVGGYAGVQSGTTLAGRDAYVSFTQNLDIRVGGTGWVDTNVNVSPTMNGGALELLSDIAQKAFRVFGPSPDGKTFRWWDTPSLRGSEPTKTVTTSVTGLAEWSQDLDQQASAVELSRDVAAVTATDTKTCTLIEGPAGSRDVGNDDWIAEVPANTSWLVEPGGITAPPVIFAKADPAKPWAGSAAMETIERATKYKVTLITTRAGDLTFIRLLGYAIATFTETTETINGGAPGGPIISHSVGPWVAERGLPAARNYLTTAFRRDLQDIDDIFVPESITDGDMIKLDQTGPGGTGAVVNALVTELVTSYSVSNNGDVTTVRKAKLMVTSAEAQSKPRTYADVQSSSSGTYAQDQTRNQGETYTQQEATA